MGSESAGDDTLINLEVQRGRSSKKGSLSRKTSSSMRSSDGSPDASPTLRHGKGKKGKGLSSGKSSQKSGGKNSDIPPAYEEYQFKTDFSAINECQAERKTNNKP